MSAPDRITLFRRIASREWHIGENGETMSHANSEAARYIRLDSPEMEAMADRIIQLETLLSEGCTIVATETEALRAGVSIDGKLSEVAEDRATIEVVTEYEGWIARCGSILGSKGATA